MCTVILLIRRGHEWPLLLGANRDERVDRPWDPPAGHWPELPGVIAGRDRSAGGTWMGVNRHGVVAAVLNRRGSLGPAPGKRSRGDLPLLALRHASAAAAAAAVEAVDAGDYRTFNLVIADAAGAIFLRGLGHGSVEAVALPAGVHMVTAHDPDDYGQPAHRPPSAALSGRRAAASADRLGTLDGAAGRCLGPGRDGTQRSCPCGLRHRLRLAACAARFRTVGVAVRRWAAGRGAVPACGKHLTEARPAPWRRGLCAAISPARPPSALRPPVRRHSVARGFRAPPAPTLEGDDHGPPPPTV